MRGPTSIAHKYDLLNKHKSSELLNRLTKLNEISFMSLFVHGPELYLLSFFDFLPREPCRKNRVLQVV